MEVYRVIIGKTMWTWILRFVVAAVLSTTAEAADMDITEAQFLSFPKLFHLDDYQRCLMQKDGVYCLGTFDVIHAPDPTYRDMKLYSKDDMNFNRMRLHRGYCLNTRCAAFNGTPTERFQHCVERWGLRRGFTLRLLTLEYCHNQQEAKPEDSQLGLFFMVLGVILLVNVLGTLYDVCGGKNKAMLAWSATSNVVHLFGSDVDESSSVPPGAKVLVAWLVIFNHVGVIHTTLNLQNPRTMEQFSHNYLVMFLRSCAAQFVVIISSFTFAEDLLKEKKPSLRLIPKVLLRKIFRIFPVHLLSLIFITQLWPKMRDPRGLQWHQVETKAQSCSDNFWYTAIFAGNLVGGSCLEHTLYFSLVIQLYIISCVVLMPVVVIHASRPLTALAMVGTLLAGSCAVTAGAAASYGWTPMMMITGPENLRNSFVNEPTFHKWYSKPWGFITACLGGIFLALLLRVIKENRMKSQYTWLTPTTSSASVMIVLVAVWAGGAGAGRAAQLALEGLVVTALALGATLVFTFLIPEFLSWYIWVFVSRMSVPLVMLCDVTAFTIVASRPVLHHVSITSWIVDVIGSISYTYLVGIPIAVLLDLPTKRISMLLF